MTDFWALAAMVLTSLPAKYCGFTTIMVNPYLTGWWLINQTSSMPRASHHIWYMTPGYQTPSFLHPYPGRLWLMSLHVTGSDTMNLSHQRSTLELLTLENTCQLLNFRTFGNSMWYKYNIFQCMDRIFCVEFQREPLKLHTKYLIHTLKMCI